MTGAAVMVAKIATSEIEEATELDDSKDKVAQELGKEGRRCAGEVLERREAVGDPTKSCCRKMG